MISKLSRTPARSTELALAGAVTQAALPDTGLDLTTGPFRLSGLAVPEWLRSSQRVVVTQSSQTNKESGSRGSLPPPQPLRGPVVGGIPAHLFLELTQGCVFVEHEQFCAESPTHLAAARKDNGIVSDALTRMGTRRSSGHAWPLDIGFLARPAARSVFTSKISFFQPIVSCLAALAMNTSATLHQQPQQIAVEIVIGRAITSA